ncbi:hypothetical protein [Gordonia sp. (in: high G+C Gram-positive bacteria)]|uniref:hypothetical protein n=1 Tax=Gordonia sp. (in: high G+C Gram-positive bacteria) TaxID=84139 RepID=UPI003F9C096A
MAIFLLIFFLYDGLLAVPLVAFLDTVFTWYSAKTELPPPSESRFTIWLRGWLGLHHHQASSTE